MDAKLMRSAGLRIQREQGKTAAGSEDLVPGDSRRSVGTDTAPHRGRLVTPYGSVDSSGRWIRGADADGPVLPAETVGVEHATETVMHVTAFRDHHDAGGALVEPACRVENEIFAALVRKGTRYRRRVRKEIGGVRGHPGGFVYDQEMSVLPENGQGPVTGDDFCAGRRMVA